MLGAHESRSEVHLLLTATVAHGQKGNGAHDAIAVDRMGKARAEHLVQAGTEQRAAVTRAVELTVQVSDKLQLLEVALRQMSAVLVAASD